MKVQEGHRAGPHPPAPHTSALALPRESTSKGADSAGASHAAEKRSTNLPRESVCVLSVCGECVC